MIRSKKRLHQLTSFDGLYGKLKQFFTALKDHRASNASHQLSDILGSAFAMFSLKCESLLAFDRRAKAEQANLLQIFQLASIPSDSQMRLVLDQVPADTLRQGFDCVFDVLEDSGITWDYRYLDERLIVSLDGVEHFRSTKVNCPSCCVKKHRNGELAYHHAMLAAVMVHPDKKEVFPLDCEPIIRQDGDNKNDCERNAAKRLIQTMAQRYQGAKFLFVQDALYANAPYIELLQQHQYNYIINVKPDGHKRLFTQLQSRKGSPYLKQHQFTDQKGTKHSFTYSSDLALNEANTAIRINMIDYQQRTKKGKITKFSWITDLPLNASSVVKIMKAARARWKIENETFNTLKNQGYHFEHNYGHGNKHLCSVLAILMFLAFLVDQVQQYASPTFGALIKGLGTRKKLWEALRSFFKATPQPSMEHLHFTIAQAYSVQLE